MSTKTPKASFFLLFNYSYGLWYNFFFQEIIAILYFKKDVFLFSSFFNSSTKKSVIFSGTAGSFPLAA